MGGRPALAGFARADVYADDCLLICFAILAQLLLGFHSLLGRSGYMQGRRRARHAKHRQQAECVFDFVERAWLAQMLAWVTPDQVRTEHEVKAQLHAWVPEYHAAKPSEATTRQAAQTPLLHPQP